jgi:hypothetical protein
MLGPVALAEPTTNNASAADKNSDLTILNIIAIYYRIWTLPSAPRDYACLAEGPPPIPPRCLPRHSNLTQKQHSYYSHPAVQSAVAALTIPSIIAALIVPSTLPPLA